MEQVYSSLFLAVPAKGLVEEAALGNMIWLEDTTRGLAHDDEANMNTKNVIMCSAGVVCVELTMNFDF